MSTNNTGYEKLTSTGLKDLRLYHHNREQYHRGKRQAIMEEQNVREKAMALITEARRRAANDRLVQQEADAIVPTVEIYEKVGACSVTLKAGPFPDVDSAMLWAKTFRGDNK